VKLRKGNEKKKTRVFGLLQRTCVDRGLWRKTITERAWNRISVSYAVMDRKGGRGSEREEKEI